MISQTAEYSLRAVVFLATQNGTAFTTDQIAKATKVPSAYLSKVLQALAKAGLVHSQRGLRGGFVMTREPQELTILEILKAVDPVQRIQTCPLSSHEHSTSLCSLHRKLDEAMALVEQSFGRTTVADLVAAEDANVGFCDYPHGQAPEFAAPSAPAAATAAAGNGNNAVV